VIRWGLALATFAVTSSASASEVVFDGSYRARFRVYDSLSIDKSLAESEGRAAYVQHRFLLRPRFLVNDKISVFADFKGLDNVHWGDEVAQWTDPVNGLDVPIAWSDDLTAPTGQNDDGTVDARAPLLDFTLWRVWAEIDTKIGKFSFGRMPIHWGSGIWQNDGMGVNAEYGDSADRVQWEKEISKIHVRIGAEFDAEGLVNDNDDTLGVNASVAYRNEHLLLGTNLQLKTAPSRDFTLFTADIATEATLGKLNVRLEGVGQFGSGDLENGATDVQVMAFGAVLAAEIDISNFVVTLEGGLATGDKNPTDEKIRTFSFDRDYNVGVILFEQPLPTLSSGLANDGGRSFGAALSGPSVSNALYLRPQVSRELPWVKGLSVNLGMLAARTMTMPDTEPGRSSYGMEFTLGARYTGIEHLDIMATGAIFLPGSYYREFADTEFISGFSGTVLGGQLITRVHF
jgi:hypothetical protein